MPNDPVASRPYMPGYGLSESDEGLLPWSWAEERLARNRNYWVGTVSSDGRPHSSAVWGVWLDNRFYFSMSPDSLKGRNLALNVDMVITTEDALEAVIVEGTFHGTPGDGEQSAAREAYAKKYDWDTAGYDFFVMRPTVAFGFVEAADKFASAATRFRFEE